MYKPNTCIKLNLEAGKAISIPPLSTILGQRGININKFCTEYNTKTSEYKGVSIPVTIFLLDNKTFKLHFHYPSFLYLISKFSYKNIISYKTLQNIIHIKRKELYRHTFKQIITNIKNILKLKKIKVLLN